MNTSQKGNVATSRVLAALIAAGKSVSIPFGDNQRYDLILDIGDKLLRIQCKIGRLKNGSICFMTSSSRRKTKDKPWGWNSYAGQVDLFGVFCPQNNTTYLELVAKLKALQRKKHKIEGRFRQRGQPYVRVDPLRALVATHRAAAAEG